MSTTLLVGLAVGGGVILVLLIVLVVVLRQPKPVATPCQSCGRIMRPDWTRCLFCGWALPSAIPRLEFMCGPLTGQNFQLSEATITTIGSVAGNTIVLSDPAVSRKHVGIRKNGEWFEFADLGSTNGVYVNGHRMPRKQLASGDVLRVGNTEMVFRTD